MINIPGLSPSYLQAQQVQAQKLAQERSIAADQQAQVANHLQSLQIQKMREDSDAPLRDHRVAALKRQADAAAALDAVTGGDPLGKAAALDFTKMFGEIPPIDPTTGKIDYTNMSIRAKEIRDASNQDRLLETYTEDVVGPDGKVSVVHKTRNRKTGEVVSQTTPGFNAAKSAYADKANAEAAESKAKAGAAQANLQSESSTVLNKIREAREKITAGNADGLPVTGWGGWLRVFPGDAQDLDTALDTIRSRVGFTELQKLRAASPTGGALGQVSERELTFLQSVIGSLKQTQSEASLRNNLDLVEKAYMDVIHRGIKDPDKWLKENGFGGGAAAPAAPAAGSSPSGFSSEGLVYDRETNQHGKRQQDGTVAPVSPEEEKFWQQKRQSLTPSQPVQPAAPAPPAVQPPAQIPSIAPMDAPFVPGQQFKPSDLTIRALRR